MIKLTSWTSPTVNGSELPCKSPGCAPGLPDLDIRAVKWIDEVLDIALERKPEPLSDEDFMADPFTSSEDSETEEKNRINTH